MLHRTIIGRCKLKGRPATFAKAPVAKEGRPLPLVCVQVRPKAGLDVISISRLLRCSTYSRP
jgi:hypothetical protein